MKPFNLTINPFLIFLLIALGIQSHAQVMIESRYASTQMIQIKDLRNFSITNSSGSPFQCIIQIEITKDDKVVSIGESAPIVLPAGNINMLTWNGANINQRSTQANTEAIHSDGSFSGGAYMACIKILDVKDKAELAVNCEAFSVADSKMSPGQASNNENKNDGKKKFPIQFHGNSEISGYFANKAPMFSDHSPNYGHVFLNPTLTVYDVPLTGTVLVSSQNSPLRQNMNVYNFSFDADAFKNNLIARLKKAVTENKKLNELSGGKLSTLGKIQNLDNMMKNPEVQKELKGIQDLESSRKQLEEIEGINKVLSGKDSLGKLTDTKNIDYDALLKSAKDSLEQVDTGSVDREKLQHRYDSLQTKSDSLQKVYQQYKGKYDSLQTTADSLTKVVNSLKHLDVKKGGYDALLNQQDGLLKEAKMNGWVDSLGNVKSTADDLSKVDMSKVNDTEYLTSQLTNMGLLKKYEKYLTWVRKFSIGTSFTQFSEYSLNNVPVSGISVELAPWKLYAAFTYGHVQRSVLTTDVGTASYKRNMIAGSIGYGTQEKTHIHINILSSEDDPNSVNPRDSIYLYYKKPQSNKVVSTDFGLNLFKDKLRISGELSGSQLVRDVTYQHDPNIIELQDTVLRSEKDWFRNIFRQKPVNLNAVTDYAFFAKAEVSLNKDKTKVSIGSSRVGADYYSFGTPFLMRDMLTFEGKVSQKFMKNKISASLYIRQMSNNLSGDKPITVNQWRWGGDLSLNFPKMPVVRITYTPIIQQNDSGTVNMNMMSANVSYPAKIKKVRLMNMLSYIFQNGSKGMFAQPFTSHYTTFNQNIMFPKGQTIGMTFSYIYTRTNIETLHSLNGTFSVGGTLFKKWNNGAGVNVYANKMEQRYMLFYRTGISFLKYFSLNVQVEGQLYRNGRPNAIYPIYDVVAVRPILNVRW